jgi:hypothetical protein
MAAGETTMAALGGAMKSYSNAVPPNVNIAQHTLQKTADEKRLQTEV